MSNTVAGCFGDRGHMTMHNFFPYFYVYFHSYISGLQSLMQTGKGGKKQLFIFKHKTNSHKLGFVFVFFPPRMKYIICVTSIQHLRQIRWPHRILSILQRQTFSHQLTSTTCLMIFHTARWAMKTNICILELRLTQKLLLKQT